MRASCLLQLHTLQLRSNGSYARPVLNGNRGRLRATRVLVHAQSNQKNEGVYFEYEAVDPNAANELAEIEDEVERQFEWSKRSRDYRAAAVRKHGRIDQKTFGITSNGPRRKGKGGKRRSNGLKPEEKAELEAEAAALSSSLGPILPDFSPVQTPAMRLPANPPPLDSGSSAAKNGASSASSSTAGPASTRGTSSASTRPPRIPGAVPLSPLAPQGATAATTPNTVSGPNAASGSPAGGGPGSKRRQRLLQRVKGGGSGEAVAAAPGDQRPARVPPAPMPASAASAAFKEDMGGNVSAVTAVVGSVAPALGATGLAVAAAVGAGAATTVKMMTAEEATAAASAATEETSLDALGGDDLSRRLSDLRAQLPPADQLPPDAQPTLALLESILSASTDQVLTGGAAELDTAENVRQFMNEEQEFREWLRATRQAAADGAAAVRQRQGGGGGGSGMSEGKREQRGVGAEEEGEQQITAADAAKLAETLSGLEDVDFDKAFRDLGMDLDSGDGEGMEDLMSLLRGSGLQEGGEGGEEAGDVMRPVSELKELMAMLESLGVEGGDDDLQGDENLSDEQVLATLKSRDPALYELLKDVPEFDEMGQDLDLGLNLDGFTEQLSPEELAELSALGSRGGPGGGGGGDADDLEALLQEMKGLGLMKQDGNEDAGGGRRTKPAAPRSSKGATAAVVDDDDDDYDDEAEEGDLAPGDLLEALVDDDDDDDSLEPQSRLKAQLALSSMFNQPADELTAKGSRGGGSDGDDDEADRGVGGRNGRRGQIGGRGLRRAPGSVARGPGAQPEDGGQGGGPPPPPLLPKPTPRRR